MQHTETFGNEKITDSEGIAWRGLPLAVLLAAVAAVAANVLVYFTASAAAHHPQRRFR